MIEEIDNCVELSKETFERRRKATNERTNERTNKQTIERTNGQKRTDGRTDGQANKRTKERANTYRIGREELKDGHGNSTSDPKEQIQKDQNNEGRTGFTK